MFDDTTPIKDCGLDFHAGNNDSMNKELQGCRETSSHLKRRRMLQFDTETERADSLEDVSPLASQWDQGETGCDDLDHSSERWLDECLKDVDMQCSPVDMDFAGSSEVQIDISEFCDPPPEPPASTVSRRVSRLPKNIILRGRKSSIQPPSKLPCSVAYPFAFIKPCEYHGDVTLKDINQKIHTPPQPKPKLPEDDLAAYPTSAFSGKPVVGKTKIRTEGGKGSITIMRTKG
ncbi:Protein XRI1 [Linum grandiflorum]